MADKPVDSAVRQRAIGAAVLFFAVLLFIVAPKPSLIAGGAAHPEPQKRAQKRSTVAEKKPQKKPPVNYSQFSHRTHVEKQKLACDSCHKFPTKNWNNVRKGDAAFADVAEFPEHSSCLNCHREQFFARERPAPVICSNCHVAVTPRDTARFLFPSLGDITDATKKRRDFVSEFGVGFPHDKHLDLIGANRPGRDQAERVRFVNAAYRQDKPKDQEAESKSCPTCHLTYQPQGDSPEEYVTKPPKNLGDAFWLKKGSFKTILNNHATCFGCHNPDAGVEPLPNSCNACHKLLPAQSVATDFDGKVPTTMGITDRTILDRWRRRVSSGTFTHEGGLHTTLGCTACHNIPTMNTVEPKTLKVAVKSCGGAEGCHITATTDDGGALNYEIDQRKAKPEFQCTKCHLAFGSQPLPANHVEVIPKAEKK